MTLLLLPFSVYQHGDEVAAKLSRQLPRMLGSALEPTLTMHHVDVRYLSSRGTGADGKPGLVATTQLPSLDDLETTARMYGADFVLYGKFGLSDREVQLEARLFDMRRGRDAYAKAYLTFPTYYFDAVEELKMRVIQTMGIAPGEDERALLFTRPTDSWQAYLYYLLAEDDRYAATLGILPHDTEGTIRLYREALEIDSEFTAAREGLQHFLVLAIEHQMLSEVVLYTIVQDLSQILDPEFITALNEIL